MYNPPWFQENDAEKLYALMRENSFATLVSQGSGAPFASHIPFLVDRHADGGIGLRSHMARANPQWNHFREHEEVLVVFQGPHAYISPSWYTSPQMAPTWNYAVVHAYGHAKTCGDAGLRAILEATVAQHESQRETPWSMDSLPEEFVAKLMRAVVGFEIEVTRVEGKMKMSQNHSADNRVSAISALFQTGDPLSAQVAQIMRSTLPDSSGDA